MSSPPVRQRLCGVPRRLLRARLLLLSWALCSAACSEPRYGEASADDAPERERDAQVVDACVRCSTEARDAEQADVETQAAPRDTGSSRSPTDGGERADASTGLPAVTPTAVLPTWAAPLLGRYAVRAFTFKQDDLPTVTRAEDVFLAEFSFDAQAGLTLRTKLCQSSAQNDLATLRLVAPSQVPERVDSVTLSDFEKRWSSQGTLLSIGYSQDPPDVCAGKAGQSVPKRAGQTWIEGSSCRCPLDGEEPLADDCRVLDPDSDDKPGFSFAFRSVAPPLGDATVYAVSESTTHFVNGQVSMKGSHVANVAGGERAFQLGCSPANCANLAELATYCPVTYNTAAFAPVDADASCQTISMKLGTLFPEPAPPIETRCFQ
jgi:hypothetical protein